MARTRSFDEDAALAAIGDVFWRRGYEGASYADLMAASGLGKGSLYAAWGDKAALYRAALRRYVGLELALLSDLLSPDRLAPGPALVALLDYPVWHVETNDDRRGCFLCNAAVDMAQADPEVRAIVEEAFANAVTAIDAVAAKAGGAEGAGAHLFSVFLGLRVMARSGAPLATMKAARDHALRTAALNS